MMSKYRQHKKERHELRRKHLRRLVNRGWQKQQVTVTRLEKLLQTARGEKRTVIQRLLKGQIGKASFDPTKGRGPTHEKMPWRR